MKFDYHQMVKRVDTGEVVRIVEVLPVSLVVFYRIESENGDTTIVLERLLREAR